MPGNGKDNRQYNTLLTLKSNLFLESFNAFTVNSSRSDLKRINLIYFFIATG